MRVVILNRPVWVGLFEKGITEQRLEKVREFALRISEKRSIPGRRPG